MVMAKSVRAAWAINQNPSFSKMGILVLIKAVAIMVNSGMAASRVRKPMSSSAPQTTSKLATKYAQNFGFSKPIFPKHPTPTISG